MNRFRNTFKWSFSLLLKLFVKIGIGQKSRLYKMQDIYFKLKALLEKMGKNEPLESPPRLGLICFKTFLLNFLILNLFYTYVAVLTLATWSL